MAEEPRKRLASTRKLIVFTLGGIGLASIAAATGLALYGVEVPGELLAIGTAAVAGVVGLAKQEDD